MQDGDSVRNLIPPDDPTFIRAMEDDIVAGDGGMVHVGNNCSDCPTIRETLAKVSARQEGVMTNQEEMKNSLRSIYDLLRTQNGTVAKLHEEVAVLKEDLKHEAVDTATTRAVLLTAAGFVAQWIGRKLGF